MTPAAFRAQVRRLLHSGYRPINARDLARGRVDVPAGMTPVVLTFDDGSPGQFALRADGRLDPDCAAGILTAECAKVPGAQPRATFYINRAPFGLRPERQQGRSLRALLELGFQLGNHTLDHANLATLPDAGVAEEFVKLQRLVARLAPSADLNRLNHLDAHPHERYVSAGNPGHVTVPKALRTHLAARYKTRLVTY